MVLFHTSDIIQAAIKTDAGARALRWVGAELLSAESMAVASREYERQRDAFDNDLIMQGRPTKWK